MSEASRAAALALAAAPGTLAGLYRALTTRMEEIAERMPLLETKSSAANPSAARAPQVVGGWLPPKVDADDEYYPFLIVRPRDGSDSEQGATEQSLAAFQILVGTYSDTDEGFEDVVLLFDAVRSSLLSQPVLSGTSFECLSLTWQLPEQQTRPQWLGTITTNWNLPRPVRVDALNPREA